MQIALALPVDHEDVLLQSAGLGLGSSTKLINCAARINVWEEEEGRGQQKVPFDVEAAMELLSCSYEDGTQWGKEVSNGYNCCFRVFKVIV
jgi:hypothetical protein